MLRFNDQLYWSRYNLAVAKTIFSFTTMWAQFMYYNELMLWKLLVYISLTKSRILCWNWDQSWFHIKWNNFLTLIASKLKTDFKQQILFHWISSMKVNAYVYVYGDFWKSFYPFIDSLSLAGHVSHVPIKLFLQEKWSKDAFILMDDGLT